jgi:hypothetical protein
MFKKLTLSALAISLLSAKAWAFYFPSPDIFPINTLIELQKIPEAINRIEQQIINFDIITILNLSCDYTLPPLKQNTKPTLADMIGLCHV